MSAHLTARQLEGLDRRSASPSELLAAMTHIASCEACREQLSSEQKTRTAVESFKAGFRGQARSNHLSYEELAACVDDSLSPADLEVLESHAGICSHCAAELADLRAFKAEMTTYPEIERRPAGSPTLLQKIIGLWRASSYRIPIRLAAAATVVLLCVSIATLVLRKDTAVPLTVVSELQHKDEAPAPAKDQGATQPPTSPAGPVTPANPATEIAETIHDGGGVVTGVVTMDTDGNVTGLDSLPTAYQKEVKTALKNKRVETPSEVRGLIGRAGVLMGSADAGPGFSLIGPVGTSVRAEKPTFRWKPLAGATSYVVSVYDSSFNKIASSESQSGTEWTPVDSLKRGETYSWQVTAIKDGKEIISPAPPAPDAKFKSLDASKVRELDRVKRMYADSHLVLGVLYQRAGLLDDAEREFKAVCASNPKSQTARKLLGDLKSLRQAR